MQGTRHFLFTLPESADVNLDVYQTFRSTLSSDVKVATHGHIKALCLS